MDNKSTWMSNYKSCFKLGTSLRIFIESSGDLIGWEGKRIILTKLAYGLSKYHGGGLFHGDIKADNVVMDSLNPKFIDFGSSYISFFEDDNDDERKYSGTLSWAAPERLKKKDGNIIFDKPTNESDVYSFGMLCYEILNNGIEPFNEQHDLGTKIVAIKRFGPKMKDYWPNELIDLIKKCINKNFKERPKMDEIYEKLNNMNFTDIQISEVYKKMENKDYNINEIRDMLIVMVYHNNDIAKELLYEIEYNYNK